MSRRYTVNERAAGKIRLTIRRLARDFPFPAAILGRGEFLVRPEVGTMAVTIIDDGMHILYNPKFILALTADELAGMLLHEIDHVLLGHVLIDFGDYPDAWALAVALELSANEFIRMPLPGDPITLNLLPSLPSLESMDKRYQRLKKVRRRGRVGSLSAQYRAPGVSDDRASGSSEVERQKTGKKWRGSGSRRWTSEYAATGPGDLSGIGAGAARGQPRSADLGQVLDDHSVWSEARREPERSKQVVCEVVREALLEVGPDRVPEYLRKSIEGLGIGSTPGADLYELQGSDRGQLNWRRLLRRYVGKELELHPTFSRPPRRLPKLIGILPGQRWIARRPRILVIIDTSASISPTLLEQIDAELAGLARRFSITVVECDSQIRRSYRYRGRLEAVQGRGGTDLRPALAPAFLRKHSPDLALYFTDGLGSAPVASPRVEVIWCLVPGGEAPATWGRVIRMDKG
jgi:predicted metal-dependent peptidase